MKRQLCFVFLGAALLLAWSGVAQAESLKEARADLAKAMEEWTQLRDLVIEVEAIEGVSTSRDPKEQLRQRLETLLAKQQSNRVWRRYWEREQRMADKVARIYETLVPADPKAEAQGLLEASMGALQKAKEAAVVEASKRQKAMDQHTKDVEKAKAWLKAKALDTAKTIAAGPRSSRLASAAMRAEAAVAEARKALEAADEGEPRTRAKVALDAAQKASDEAAKAWEERQASERLVELATAVPKKLPEGLPIEVAKRAERIIKDDATQKGLEQALKEAQAKVQEATAALDNADAEKERLRQRRKVLTQWSDLARAKQSNQDNYLKAIKADITAVKERLNVLEGQPEFEMLNRSERVCQSERDRDQNSLQKFYACKKAAEQERRELTQLVANVTGAIELNGIQTASVAQLADAQNVDVRLVKRELAVSSAEVKRDPKEQAAWLQMWQEYSARALGKRKALTDALRTSLELQHGLDANLGMLKSELKAKQQRVKDVDERLAATASTGGLVWALVKTAWEFIRRGYMVPVYLLIAWLLLRLGRRVEEKVVVKARENASNRDHVQRVETLSTVARGAFKLVVYVATFLMCLVAVGVDIGPLLGGAAIFGLAISFGSQSLVKDVVTGFFILLEDQFAVGDYISTAGVAGTVEKVTLRRTVLRDLKGAVHTVPNGSITSVSNMSQGWARVVINLGLAYGTDLAKVEEVINRLGDAFYAEEQWNSVLHEPPRYIGMTKFDASSIVVRCMFKTEQDANYGAERAFNRLIHDTFAAEGIEIPYNKLDVNLSSALPNPAKAS